MRAMKPIPDKAEIALEYPDKLYIGTFERSSRFDAHFDETGISLTLYHGGDESVRKSVRMHIHYALFAEILADLAKSAQVMPADEVSHRDMLAQAARALAAALRPKNESSEPQDKNDDTMSAEEEVELLHILE
jgi:hypothetical protein